MRGRRAGDRKREPEGVRFIESPKRKARGGTKKERDKKEEKPRKESRRERGKGAVTALEVSRSISHICP